MYKQIIVDVKENQTRVAILEDDELVEYYTEDADNHEIVGNIYRGKVINVLPGMQAAFVDIGLSKNAFLYIEDVIIDDKYNMLLNDDKSLKDLRKRISISDVIKEGQEVTVQVVKEPIGSKGARVTMYLTLPGKYLVMIPNSNKIGISKKILDEEERNRLKKMVEEIKPENMGVIMRTASKNKEIEDFHHEVDFLTRLWSEIKNKESKGRVPRVLYKNENILYRIFRDIFTDDIDELILNSNNGNNEIMEWEHLLSPVLRRRVKIISEGDVFSRYLIDSKVRSAMQRKVRLNNGGYIVIEPTEALTVIDVNTGKFVGSVNLEDTVSQTNLIAAKEIARQIRLRDIGGIIIIDFIDMSCPEHRTQLLDVLREEFKKDRTKTHVIDITGLGLVEITRKQVREGLSVFHKSMCPHCNGTGIIKN